MTPSPSTVYILSVSILSIEDQSPQVTFQPMVFLFYMLYSRLVFLFTFFYNHLLFFNNSSLFTYICTETMNFFSVYRQFCEVPTTPIRHRTCTEKNMYYNIYFVFRPLLHRSRRKIDTSYNYTVYLTCQLVELLYHHKIIIIYNWTGNIHQRQMDVLQ